MKKTYLAPVLYCVNVSLEGRLLVDSGTGLTVKTDETVEENFAKDEFGTRPRYDVWEEDWNEGEE